MFQSRLVDGGAQQRKELIMRSRRLTLVHAERGRTPAGTGGTGRRSRSSPSAVVRQGSTPSTPPPEPSFMRDSYASTAFAEVIDRSVHAATARFTAGLSPMALVGAYIDWAAHLAFSPGKQLQAGAKRPSGSRCASPTTPAAARWAPMAPSPASSRCRRTSASTTRRGSTPPFNLIYQSFLLHAAVVAQRDDGRPRRDARSTRTLVDVRDAADARRVVAVELAVHQSGGAASARAPKAA